MSYPCLPLLCFSLLCLAPLAQAQDGDPILPYRPSVASPAQLPVPGQLEFEAGGLLLKTHATHRASLPYTFKLALTPEWGVLLGGEVFVRARNETGRRDMGLGDATVVLKRAFLLDSTTALGLELGWKLPTAKDAIGSGKRDVTVNGIFSRDLGVVHMDERHAPGNIRPWHWHWQGANGLGSLFFHARQRALGRHGGSVGHTFARRGG